MEAALDEANVFRFSQYLKEFSEETQFIVITHRKGTMEEADVLVWYYDAGIRCLKTCFRSYGGNRRIVEILE